jgi:hypothetical protein
VTEPLAARLALRLAEAARDGVTLGYGTLAAELGVPVRELTAALEATMAEDAAAGRPLRAVLMRARLSAEGLPAPGFFAAARALGIETGGEAAFAAGQRAALYALARVGR